MDEQEINEEIADELSARTGKRYEVDGGGVIVYDEEYDGFRLGMKFTASFSTCRLFEETLSEEEWHRYLFNRWKIARSHINGFNISWPSSGAFVEVEKRTADERCEAFLRTINKWRGAANG